MRGHIDSYVVMSGVLGAALLAGCGVARGLLPGARSPGSATQAGAASAGGAAARPLPPVADEGITSEAHRRFVGQIVFSTAQIPKQHADEAQLGAEFYADELLYGRAYLPHSVENEAVYEVGSDRPQRAEIPAYYYKLYVDGAPVEHELESRTVSLERRRSTTLQVWPHPSAADEPTPRGWVELVNGLAPGDHVVRIELWAHDRGRRARAPLAAGELTLHKPAGIRLGTGRTFADLERGMTDAALSRELLGMARAFATKHGWKETMAEVAIKSPAWIEIRHATLKHVIGRRLLAWARADWPDGRCTAQALTFEQHVKAGQPTGPIYVGSSGEQVLLDCAASTTSPVDRWGDRRRARPTPTSSATATAVTASTAATVRPGSSAPAASPAPAASARIPRAPTTVATVASSSSSAPPPAAVSARATPQASDRPGWFSVGLGLAANARDATGVASYANLGVHVGRLQLGVGATWPLNAVGYVRFAVIARRFELSPMIAMTVLAEDDAMTTTAVSGGLSVAYALTTGPLSAGLRVEALVSYNPEPADLALPVLGSMYVRF